MAGRGTRRPSITTNLDVDCDQCRDLLSDALDDRLDRVRRASLETHLVTCATCRAYGQELSELHRRVRLRAAEDVPDLSERILARAHPPNKGRSDWICYALLVVGLTELTLALPALILGEDAGAPIHVARHVGSMSVALAVGLVYAAWRPVRAFGLLPIAGALAACMVVTAVLDLADGRVAPLGEAHHVLDVAGLLLLWLLAGAPRPYGRRPRVRARLV
jgi:predicted anti-sigma-YlaC factor YlaD